MSVCCEMRGLVLGFISVCVYIYIYIVGFFFVILLTCNRVGF